MDLEFYYSFGVNSDLIRNMTFYNDTSVIFIAGKLCILFDIETYVQSIIHIVDGCELTALSRCENHLLVAIIGKDKPPSLCLFNIDSSTKRIFHGPAKIKSDRFHCISISTSLKFIAAQGYDPDWVLVIWSSTTREIIALFNPTSGKPRSFVHDISFHAGEREEVVVVGRDVFRVYEYQNEDGAEFGKFAEVIFEKYEEGERYFSIAWPQKENLAVCSLSGKILFFRGIDLVHEISVFGTLKDNINIDLFFLTSSSSQQKGVTGLGCTAEHLVCVVAGRIFVVYEGTEISEYSFCRCVYLPTSKTRDVFPGEASLAKDFITHFDFSVNSQVICATTSSGRLLYLDICNKNLRSENFKILLQRQHRNTIIAMDVARGRPLVATCCEQFVILWNYKTKNQELIMRFKDTILCLAIHPSGLYLVLCFAFHARVCCILHDKLKEYRRLNSKNCFMVSFSYGGHLLSLSSNTAIEVYDFLTFERLAKFEGHCGHISSLEWKDGDTKLVSCGERGVICEWDVISLCKLWDNCAVMSYSCLDVIPGENAIIAVGSCGVLKCVADGSVLWEYKCQKALSAITISADAKTLYTGASDGCIRKFSLPLTSDALNMFAHKGEITEMRFSLNYGLLFSVSIDGLLFAWKTGILVDGVTESVLGNTVLTNVSDITDLKERIELLRMSIKQCEIAFEFEAKLNRLNHEEIMKNMFIDHEMLVKDLNQTIGDVKDEIELVLFDSDVPKDLQELENSNRKTLFEQAEALALAYDRNGNFIKETLEIVDKCEGTLIEMEKDYTESWAHEVSKEEQILKNIADLQRAIEQEQQISQSKREGMIQDKKKFEEERRDEEDHLKELQEAYIEAKKFEIDTLANETMRLRHMVKLMKEDSLRKRKIASGQVDFDINEKLNAVEVLRRDFHSLKDKLKAKEKIALNQDIKYFEMRRVVGNLQRCHSVFKSTVERLKSEIKSIESETESCLREIKNVNDSIPLIEEKIRLSDEQTSTLDKKLRETIEGFRDKRTLLRDNQHILSKYKSLLHESLSQFCDAKELRKNILHLFDQVKSGVDESLDPNLKKEFSHQIQALQNTYQYIKADPTKVTKEQSLAEFKLSQENSKLLKEVHEIQKEQERLRDIIFEMEVAMGMPHTRQAKITKKINELRDKIEFVVSVLSQSADDKQSEIRKLDNLIEEQQYEIHRLKSELTSKQESGKR
ncbi:Cilia- and flagella-associated protein 57 like protein [Argiope bruennichi]|uniref:Cilia- and flagella-associated protein 57 like protein n=1 Tax=Argiope bruennichi TaxID=94029 RepID=A0A8T0FBT5_ARGBR|nr:Cilia- and flagella-associated protein 57 like protein [Argiope bruennichi]